MKDILQKAAQIELVIFDVDGVLTDGSLFFGDDGQEYKAFHSRDGHGMKMLRNSGVEVAIITGRTSQVVTHRMANLGIEHVYQGKQEKLPAFEELIAKLQLTPGQ
ncbi:MAG TPA: 3-deoxy-D-manno-octulosonate 8-phosphate phosphatase, partial [Chromatiales bacterium]|nr:3-deoxy-D-manno-octulosonate 8-phosphate phosphatase [Chromatiales bacterium]HEX21805.1 3-deoxy-D-manno-octulosonate 8-phosphate phosphatase [Chromatiales bacterium]